MQNLGPVQIFYTITILLQVPSSGNFFDDTQLHIHVFLHYRYDLVSNSWQKESGLPRKAPCNSSCGFVVLNGELHVLSLLKGGDTTESRRSRQQKRAGSLLIQIYQPRKRTWRSLITKPPFHCPLDFNTAVMCTIQL